MNSPTSKPQPERHTLHAPTAWIANAWQDNVVLELEDGHVTQLDLGVAAPRDAERLSGPVLPGMANLHSHAFQRAMAGLTDRRLGTSHDSFWTWRQSMYSLVERLTPRELEVIAAMLYLEMLKSGYTAVGEFHYLHNAGSGTATESTRANMRAATRVGIGITHLPVLYRRGGFDDRPLSEAQRRFYLDDANYSELIESLCEQSAATDARVGIALHSLRAVSPEDIDFALELRGRLIPHSPVHIHIAEQPLEVADCMATLGQRPVEWLCQHAPVDQHWCCVHATHMSPDEIVMLAESGAVAGICPTTEASLGDGIFASREFLRAGGTLGIGSDSHVSVSPIEELRWLEYAQRLATGERAVLHQQSATDVASYLYTHASKGGAQALGLGTGNIEVGARADFVVLDTTAPQLLGLGSERYFGAYLFSGNHNPVADVMVRGEWQVRASRHPLEQEIYGAFAELQKTLWT